MNFAATVRHRGSITIIDATGELTSFVSGALSQVISAVLKSGHKKIILNLRGLTYLDSSGVGALVQNYMSVIRRDGEMKVVGLTPRVEEILKITQLYRVLHEFDDEDSALRELSGVAMRGSGLTGGNSQKS